MLMKKTRLLAVAAAVLGAMLLVLALTPLVFRDSIVARVKAEANQAVNARVDWRDAGLSLLGDFPNLTLRLDDLSIAGTGRFAGDTLARMRRLQLVLDLGSVVRSVWGGGRIVVRSVALERPVVSLLALEDGTANWDIVK